MSKDFTTKGFQDLLSFPFRAPDAKRKLLIAGLLGLASFIIPIIPTLFLLACAGMIMRCMILDKVETFMPDWNDWNEMLVLGLKIGGARLVYTFPILVTTLLGYLGMLVPAFLQAFSGGLAHQSGEALIEVQIVGVFGGKGLYGRRHAILRLPSQSYRLLSWAM